MAVFSEGDQPERSLKRKREQSDRYYEGSSATNDEAQRRFPGILWSCTLVFPVCGELHKR
ncbi:hypothetical protein CSUI_011355 [Cystoisospora suis]|uniref:Uncharacterized protein n=1 Tax=Cystoisospora suis TaxID=483139 RepID=A0A2C6KEC1_9APIC|nr:hypothetical protein CSUI_011355 [Cystoisospora suis]